jgi:hypothetical protein
MASLLYLKHSFNLSDEELVGNSPTRAVLASRIAGMQHVT